MVVKIEMSRLAKKSIKILSGVTMKNEDGFHIFQGPKGESRLKIDPATRIRIERENIFIELKDENGDQAREGTVWSLMKNAIQGVAEGFVRILEIEGVGYRAQLEGKDLVLFLGYAEPVRFGLPEGVKVEIDKNVIKISGVDKELVGRVAADIRALKKPEPYKGKGIHYRGEVIKRKVGKKAAATGAAT